MPRPLFDAMLKPEMATTASRDPVATAADPLLTLQPGATGPFGTVMPDRPRAIRTVALSRRFGDRLALDNVTIEVPAGIVFGLLGPNGAGKTTMIRILLGLLEPTSGRAEALGLDPTRAGARIREKTGALLEHTGLYERLSAEDNLEFYGRAWRIPPRVRRERIRDLLQRMGLWERRRDRAGSWSRGMKQKLAIARAMLHRPSLLFLDEPTAGLDPRAAYELRTHLAELANREGVTVFLTTHNLAEAEELCELVALIRRGRIVAAGSPLDLRERLANRSSMEIAGSNFERALDVLRVRRDVVSAEIRKDRLHVELAAGATVGPILAQLVEAGATVEEAVRSRATLEQVFLSLTGDGA